VPDAVEVSVVIPARDAETLLAAALAALTRQTLDAEFEVIVVDDGSRDGTVGVAEAAPLPVRIVRGSGEGPAAARNRGAAVAAGRVLAFTDADCEPAPDWLAAGLRATGDAELVQGRVEPPTGAHVGPYDRHITVVDEYGLYETANLFVERALFEQLGGFQSILVPRHGKELGEDVWLGWRARRSGARTAFADDALVYHAVFPRGALGYAAERARLRFFPELARQIPELREHFFHRRWFLNARSAAFDAAVGGVAAAIATRRLAPLLLAAPYLRVVARSTGGRPRRGRAVVAEMAADGIGAAALAFGSVRSRSLLL
jgi:glycosyltransferase involved in cell wall biosynthesis